MLSFKFADGQQPHYYRESSLWESAKIRQVCTVVYYPYEAAFRPPRTLGEVKMDQERLSIMDGM